MCDKIESVQINFCKRLACLNQNVTNSFALAECGRLPLNVDYMFKCVKYWVTLTQMATTRYPKQCYLMLRRLDDVGRVTWATHIKHFLFLFGFGHAWISNELGNSVTFLNICHTRLVDCAKQTLLGDINSRAKGLHYKLFKSLIEPERYLSTPLSYRLKHCLSNFRCSGHQLMIEKGRHVGIDREYRFCPLCLHRNVYSIENEFHFLLVCPVYNHIRDQCFMNNWLECTISEHLFVLIMSDTRQQAIFALGRYIDVVYKLRESSL